MKKTNLAVSTIILCLLLWSFSLSPNGSATPKELIKAAKNAGSDTKALKPLYYWSTPEEEANVDAVLKLKSMKPEVDAFLKEGEKKFGDKFSPAFGMGTFVLVLPTAPTPYDKMLETGEFVESGDSAYVTVKIVEGNTTSTAKSDMIKKDGNWYFPAPTSRGKKTPVQVTTLIQSFFDESKKALAESSTSEKFAERINTFMKTKMN